MDVVTLSAAKADTRRRYPQARPSNLFSILGRNQQDATMQFIGDSTGNETTEWIYLTVQAIAAQFPTYTVVYRLWNHGSQAYDAPVTVQTGTGVHTLSVYNASVPGENASYVYNSTTVNTRMPLMVPVSPTLTVFSYGYNWGSAPYRWEIMRAVRVLRGYHPLSDIPRLSGAYGDRHHG